MTIGEEPELLPSIAKFCSLVEEFDSVYFYAVDPGAFAVMVPISESLEIREKKVYWITEGWCAENINCPPISNNVQAFLQRSEIDTCRSVFVLGSQRDFCRTREVIVLAHHVGFYTIFLFDHWGNYLNHFWNVKSSKLSLPDIVCVMDDLSKQGLIQAFKDISMQKAVSKRVAITGHPGIEEIIRKMKTIGSEHLLSLKSRYNPENKKVILFLLEPKEDDFGYDKNGKPLFGYNEYTVLDYFLTCYPLKNTKVLIKPHPRQDLAKLDSFFSENPSCQDRDLEVVKHSSLEEMLAIADEVTGMTTVALVTALKAGKKIKSIQVGRNELAMQHSIEYFEQNLII